MSTKFVFNWIVNFLNQKSITKSFSTSKDRRQRKELYSPSCSVPACNFRWFLHLFFGTRCLVLGARCSMMANAFNKIYIFHAGNGPVVLSCHSGLFSPFPGPAFCCVRKFIDMSGRLAVKILSAVECNWNEESHSGILRLHAHFCEVLEYERV